MHSPINIDLQKKGFGKTCLMSWPSKIDLLSVHDLEHKLDKRKSTQMGSLVQVIEGRATDILVVQSFRTLERRTECHNYVEMFGRIDRIFLTLS